MSTKKCTRCNVVKELVEFHNHKKCKQGVSSICKNCLRIQVQERRRKNPASKLLTQARCRARAANIPFNIDINDIVVPELCPVLNIPLVINFGQKTQAPNSPSLDKVNPELGYVKGNIRVISNKANFCKSNLTEAQLKSLYTYVQEHNRKIKD